MAGAALFALVLLANLAQPLAVEQAARSQQNPVRKVVTLLQSLQKKVEAEGAQEKELYDKFMCYCSGGKGDLEKSIAAGEEKLAALGPGIEAEESKLSQAKADLEQAKADRESGKLALAEATALREKEAAAFAKEKADYDTNIAAIAKAVAAIEQGVAGSFLQTAAAQALRRVATGGVDMADVDRQSLVAFLSQQGGYAPASGEVTGILKQLSDEMIQSRTEAVGAETAAVASYEELKVAKTKEIEVLQVTIEAKLKQVGEIGVAIEEMKADLGDTEETLEADKKFLAELQTSCATKVSEWELRSKTRGEELVALADTIKILNDDDALELFKKTLPGSSASLLQLQVSASSMRSRALAAIREAQGAAGSGDQAGLDLLALALSGKKAMAKGGFEKVITLIDELVASLKKEQEDDDTKKDYCAKEFDAAEDKKKELERAVSDAESAIATTNETIATLTVELGALASGIRALDKSVAEATAQRQAENAEFKDLKSSDTAALELLGVAKNRLNKFYNPKLYKAPPKRELSAEDRIVENMGGTVPTPAPSGIAGTGVTAFVQVRAHTQLRKEAPAPPPETWGAYATKHGETTGVIAMMDLLIKDLEKELTEAETEEKNAQEDYEKLMADSAAKRAADSEALTQKESAKAQLEVQLEAYVRAKSEATTELMDKVHYIQLLHNECDWLLQYFDMRKQARTDEVDALGKAKAVLSGADYALVQTAARVRTSLRRAH